MPEKDGLYSVISFHAGPSPFSFFRFAFAFDYSASYIKYDTDGHQSMIFSLSIQLGPSLAQFVGLVNQSALRLNRSVRDGAMLRREK